MRAMKLATFNINNVNRRLPNLTKSGIGALKRGLTPLGR